MSPNYYIIYSSGGIPQGVIQKNNLGGGFVFNNFPK